MSDLSLHPGNAIVEGVLVLPDSRSRAPAVAQVDDIALTPAHRQTEETDVQNLDLLGCSAVAHSSTVRQRAYKGVMSLLGEARSHGHLIKAERALVRKVSFGVIVLATLVFVATASAGPIVVKTGDRMVRCNMSGKGKHRLLYCAGWKDAHAGKPVRWGFAIGKTGVKVGHIHASPRGWWLTDPKRHWWNPAFGGSYSRLQLWQYNFFRRGIACAAGFRVLTCRQNTFGRYLLVRYSTRQIEVFKCHSDKARRVRVFRRRF